MARTSTCKAASCGAPIQWARNVETGRGMPIDPDPVEDGNVIVDRGDYPDLELRSGEWPVRVLSASSARALGPGTLRYQAHFRSCADADAFRRDRAAHGSDRRR